MGDAMGNHDPDPDDPDYGCFLLVAACFAGAVFFGLLNALAR